MFIENKNQYKCSECGCEGQPTKIINQFGTFLECPKCQHVKMIVEQVFIDPVKQVIYRASNEKKEY